MMIVIIKNNINGNMSIIVTNDNTVFRKICRVIGMMVYTENDNYII